MFVQKLEERIQQMKLLAENDRLLIGVSGGPDSMALLDGLAKLSSRYQWWLGVVHVNHGLRGEESDEEAEYVQSFCQKIQVECAIETVPVQKILEQNGGNKQEVARKFRYQAFARVAERWQVDRLVLAHHADDQVETILMRLIRGTSVSGLQGIPLRRVWHDRELVRPLLSFEKQELEEYCRQEQLQPRMDSSNLSSDYTRNRIRHRVLPEMIQIHSQTKRSILQLQRIVQEEELFWQEQIHAVWDQVVIKKNPEQIVVNLTAFQPLAPSLQRRLLKLLLNYLVKDGTKFNSWNQIEQARYIALHNHPSVGLTVQGGVDIYREYNHMILQERQDKRAGGEVYDPIPIQVPGITELPFFQGRLMVEQRSNSVEDRKNQAIFDADQLSTNLGVRSRKPGDRMTVWGMEGNKKVKKLFMEAKVARHRREEYPILVADEQIIWIPGIRRSKIAPVTPQTRRFLVCYWIWD